jgi:uncharacterized protein
LIARKLDLPTQSCFLFGPRGTGKTSWLRNEFPVSVYIDLLESNTHNRLLAYPQRLEEMIPLKVDGPIIIDEIQKVPELLNEVHRLIEKRKLSFILTGSSARKLRKAGSNLLAGRALTKYIFPLIPSELNDDFEFEKALKFGLLPTIYDVDKDINAEEYLSSYIQTYLKEEVLQEGLTRNIGTFTRFLETASFSQGEALNMSSVARECSVNRKMAESYFEILEDLLIASRVQVFQKKAKRKMSQHPKFYFFDVGVYRAIRPKGPLDSPEEIDGAAIETLTFQIISAWIEYSAKKLRLYYWRTQNGEEVDFILYGEDGLIALEVKRKSRFDKRDLKGLQTFKKDYPICKAFFAYGGKENLCVDGVNVRPLNQILKNLESLLE